MDMRTNRSDWRQRKAARAVRSRHSCCPLARLLNRRLLLVFFLAQPPMTEHWNAGLGPHTPVIKDGKLYGRGGGQCCYTHLVKPQRVLGILLTANYAVSLADDGYSLFAAINALQVLQAQGLPHARAVVLIEFCEESGSRDLPHFLELKKKEVGEPSLVFCLDSGCHNYEQVSRGAMQGTIQTKLTLASPVSALVLVRNRCGARPVCAA